MNPLDICIIALCGVLAVFGLLRGFVRQAASIAGLILGHILAVRYNAWFIKVLRLDFTHSGVAAYVVALLAIYVAVRLLGLLVERWVRAGKLSGADRFLGAVAGALKGALFSVLLVFVLVVLLPRDAALMKGSKLAPYALVAAGWLEKTFPERIGESFREKLRHDGKEKEAKKETAPATRSGSPPRR